MSLEDELEALKEENDRLKRDQTWTAHVIDESGDTGGLPVPRLELRWVEHNENSLGYQYYCRYDLVKCHLTGSVDRIPLGGTSSSRGPDIVKNGKVDTPFRDGAHIRFDAREMGLPAYAIYKDTVTELDPHDHPGVSRARAEMGKDL